MSRRFTDWFSIFRHILGQFFPRKWNLRHVYERIRNIRYLKGKRNVIKTNKLSFSGMQVLMTGLWDLKDILKSRQNRSKNKLVRENAVTRVRGSCSLQVMGSWRSVIQFWTKFNFFFRPLIEKSCGWYVLPYLGLPCLRRHCPCWWIQSTVYLHCAVTWSTLSCFRSCVVWSTFLAPTPMGLSWGTF